MSFSIVYLLTPWMKKLAFKIDFLDKPRPDAERKIHKEAIPLTAGIAIFIGFFCTYIIFNREVSFQTLAIFMGSLMILCIGLVDDWYKTHRKEFAVLPRFIIQVAAAVLVYKSGIVFTGFYNHFTGNVVTLPQWLQFLLSITWIFGVTTVINWSDGMDGVAGGLSCISAGTLFVVALAKGQSYSAMLAIILVGVSLSYLQFNKHPAKIFMGDAGATFLGFMLGIIALDGAFKQATVLSIFVPILALGLPIFDNLYVIIKRMMQGKPAYQADASQIHYRLLSSGLSPKQVVAFLYLVSVCLSLTSIILMLINV